MSCTNESSKGKPKPNFQPVMNRGSLASREEVKNGKDRNGMKRNNFSTTDRQYSNTVIVNIAEEIEESETELVLSQRWNNVTSCLC